MAGWGSGEEVALPLPPHQGSPRDSGVFRGTRGPTIPASPNWEEPHGAWRVVGPKEGRRVWLPLEQERQIISRWTWVGPGLSPEPGNRREEEEDSTGGRGWQVRLLAGRMYSEGCLARGGRGWGTCECLDGPAHPTPGKVSPGETRVSVSALEGAGGP